MLVIYLEYEPAAKKIHGKSEGVAGEFGIVAQALVAEEGVGGVELIPGEVNAGGGECLIDQGAAFGRHVRVLAAKDEHQLAAQLGGAGEGVVIEAGAEAVFVQIGGIKAGGGGDLGFQGGAVGEMAADARAEGAEATGAGVVVFQIREHGAVVVVVGGEGFGGFESIAGVGACLVVGENGVGGQVFVVDLGQGDDEAMAGEKGGGAADGRGELENLRVKQQPRVAAGCGGTQHERAHGAGRGGQIDEFGFAQGHVWAKLGWRWERRRARPEGHGKRAALAYAIDPTGCSRNLTGMRSSRSRIKLRSTLWLYLCCVALSLVWLLLDRSQVLQPLEKLTRDARFLARGPLPSPLNLIYVDIDGQAQTELGNFPWDRGIFSQICETLVTHGGVKAVGIDVVFSEAGIPNLADRAKLQRGQAEFGRYLFGGAPVVLAASYASGMQIAPDGSVVAREIPLVKSGGGKDAPEVPQWRMGPMTFTPPLVGLIDTLGGDTRRVPLYVPTNERNYFQISFELARLHFGLRPGDVQVFPDRVDLVRENGEVARSVPLIDEQMVDVNWFSPWIDDGNPRISAAEIYKLAQMARSDDEEARAAVKEWFADDAFKDAIVLIGPVDPLLQDLAPTPFDPVPAPKVGVHGNLLKTIVSGRFIQYPPEWFLPVVTFLLTALVAGLSLASEGARSAVLRVLAGVLLVGYVGLSFLIFEWADWMLPMTVPIGSALSAAFVGGATQLVLAQKQKSRIKGLFGAYLAPSVVSQMVDSGQEPKLGGVEEEITAYFSDVQSFSTFSEVLTPPQLVELMNEYLTACTDIVQAEGGTLDKYIGDAVVAMYGAPIPLADHAYHSAVAALRVQRRCGELRDKWRGEMPEKKWPEIVTRLRTRIGLNTGRAVVGNMGSETRFSYTMMGDTVNLAARMESGAKAWGVFTMCTETTRAACLKASPDRIVFRALGRVVVKGRTAPVPIYELVGLSEDVTERTREAIALFEAGLERFYAQDWDAALEKFRASEGLEPNQVDPSAGVSNNPSVVYQQLVAELRTQALGADWNGAYVMHGK